jgi:hypothetical protein
MAPSCFSLLLLFPKLLILKKFLSFCGKGLWPVLCLFVIERPEKFRFSLFSLGKELGEGDEL